MQALDGTEPPYAAVPGGKLSNANQTFLDESGFNFMTSCVAALEGRGLEDQGMYRVVGVASKVTKLMTMGLDRRRCDNLNLEDNIEWETKTVTSAIKTFLRNLPGKPAQIKCRHALRSSNIFYFRASVNLLSLLPVYRGGENRELQCQTGQGGDHEIRRQRVTSCVAGAQTGAAAAQPQHQDAGDAPQPPRQHRGQVRQEPHDRRQPRRLLR